MVVVRLYAVVLFFQAEAWQHPGLGKINLKDENEVVHFFAIGDWGAQPYQTWPNVPNGGSMHNSCRLQQGSERCEAQSSEWQREENAQKNVMEQMQKVAEKNPIHWIVNIGDNFYFEGVSGTSNWHWGQSFENMYGDSAFHVPWFSVLGNHDYGGDCCAKDLFGGAMGAFGIWGHGVGQASVTAQFDYDSDKSWEWPARKENRWVMPYWNWTKVVDLGPYKVQMVGIDTNIADATKQCLRCGGCSNTGTHPEVLKRGCPPDEGHQCFCFFNKLFAEQLDFLEQTLKVSVQDSSIRWRFVVAHHPWNFIPRYGTNGLDRFLNILETYKVQVLFTGHVHSMRHDIIKDKIHMVMTGSSGGYQYDGGDAPAGDPVGETVWSSKFLDYGFAHLQMTKDTLNVSYINDKGKYLTSILVEAEPTYFYDPQPWGTCSNSCGEGTFTREVKCMHVTPSGNEEVDLSICDRKVGLVKPPLQDECFLSQEPLIKFCNNCTSSTECSLCLEGFKWDGKACRNEDTFVVVNYEVNAPPQNEWRQKLGPMFSSFIQNMTNKTEKQVPIQSYAIVPSPPPAIMSRRLDAEVFQVQSFFSVPEAEAKTFQDVLLKAKSKPDLIPSVEDSVSPSIRSITSVWVLCPGLAQAPDGSCKGPEDPDVPDVPDAPGSTPTRSLWLPVTIAVVLGVTALGALLFRRSKEPATATTSVRSAENDSVLVEMS